METFIRNSHFLIFVLALRLLPCSLMAQQYWNEENFFLRLSETNFARGRYQFAMQPDDNVVLNLINLPTGYLYVLRSSNQIQILTLGKVVPATENYHRATLNFDGVFVLYSHPKNFTTGTGSWSVVIRTMPENICVYIIGALGSATCGFN
ncbi:hypothetical protein Tsubulata_030889 [Turnera subulata]|uniref:Bulb-type lectin domain-containing protein n=1 Tax=Turnera subulata TaxID=218843 RepID=A0A9Q0JC37_9ROSI|nr:hypothetical protein Tsubulata_030889 [Turnera subulata]